MKLIAEVIEAQFIAGGVRHVAGVSRSFGVCSGRLGHESHAGAEQLQDWANVLRIAPGQVGVGRRDVDAEAAQRKEHRGQCRRQRLPFSRRHLGNRASGHGHAGQELRVEKCNSVYAARGFQHQGKSGHEDLVLARSAPLRADARSSSAALLSEASSKCRKSPAAVWIASKTFCEPVRGRTIDQRSAAKLKGARVGIVQDSA